MSPHVPVRDCAASTSRDAWSILLNGDNRRSCRWTDRESSRSIWNAGNVAHLAELSVGFPNLLHTALSLVSREPEVPLPGRERQIGCNAGAQETL